jgi:hypothetical protein
MDMDGMAAMPTAGPGLSGAGLNLSNETVASDFLAAILYDGVLQPEDWAYAEAFWYGMIVVIGISAIINLIRLATLESRFVLLQPASKFPNGTLLTCAPFTGFGLQLLSAQDLRSLQM